MARFPNFCGESYVSQSRLASLARSVNFYPERMQTERGKVEVALYPTPGLAAYAAAPESPGRGLFAPRGKAFAIIGPSFYEVMSAGTLTLRGSVTVDGTPVTWAENGDGGEQLMVTSNNQAYLYDFVTHAFAVAVSDVSMVVMLDARFVGLDVNSSTLRISNLLNGLVWDPTQIAQRDTAPDGWKALALTSSKELFLLGEETGDVWYNAGTFPFPFAPRQGLLIRPGIRAPYSLKELNGAMIWLSQSKDGPGPIVRAEGYAPRPISNHAVDFAISGYSRTDDAVAFTYEDQGHHFYEINFPTADRTWVWDEDTNWWHERGAYDRQSGTYLAWGPQYHMSAFGHHLVADHRSGAIARMAITEYQDLNGAPLRRLRIAPGLANEQKRMYIDEFRLYLDRGIGLASGQGVDPTVMLQTSIDGGDTWGSERWRSAGRQGKTKTHTWWTKLGSGEDWAFAVAMSDPVPWRIVDASLTVRMGNK